MASTGPKHDPCSYDEKLRRSVGPGMYMLTTPANDEATCSRDVPADPFLRYQAWGPNACPPGKAVEDGSELLGLNYKISQCSSDSYLPGRYPSKGACAAPGRADPRACMAPTESTRLSNPPCTLRATGWNRWEWLCWDPQERAIVPFEWNVSYRTVVKDNHRPCVPVPMDQAATLPPAENMGVDYGKRLQDFQLPKGCPAQPHGNPYDPTPASCATVRAMGA